MSAYSNPHLITLLHNEVEKIKNGELIKIEFFERLTKYQKHRYGNIPDGKYCGFLFVELGLSVVYTDDCPIPSCITLKESGEDKVHVLFPDDVEYKLIKKCINDFFFLLENIYQDSIENITSGKFGYL